MKLVIKDKHNRFRVNYIVETIISFLVYSLVFYLMSMMFKSFYINTNYFGSFVFLAVLVMSILNVTLKPLLVRLTIPLTGLTLGLFYPFINLFILKLTDWILVDNFQLENIFIAFFIALLMSLINGIINFIFLKPILRKVKVKNE